MLIESFTADYEFFFVHGRPFYERDLVYTFSMRLDPLIQGIFNSHVS